MEHRKSMKGRHLCFIFKLAPLPFLEMIVWSIFNCILSLLNVWASKNIVSLLSAGYSKKMLGLVGFYGSFMIMSAAYSFYYKRYRVQFCVIPAFEQKIKITLFKKSARISNEAYEDSSAVTRIRLADGAKQNLFRYVEIWISILTAVIQALVVTLYVSSFDAWFLMLLPFSSLAPVLNILQSSDHWKRHHKTVEQLKKEEEEYWKGLIDEVACKESKITHASDLLLEKWKKIRTQRDGIDRKKTMKLFVLQTALVPLDFLGSFGGYLISVILLLYGKIDYAACTAGITAYASIMSAFSSLVSMIGHEGQYREMIRPFFDYLETVERSSCETDITFHKAIRLDHVSFKYPKQEKKALDNINLTIKKGEVVAIVGENGAGKTTLTNIILGLFLPSGGTIYYDEKDISESSEQRLHMTQSLVPQSFVRYKMTLRDNIAIGAFDQIDEARIMQKKLAFFDDAQLPMDTMLGKEFGGRDLSGGQWQQLSCARGFYKNSDFLVLDEATSAIDPLKEKAMYDAFKRELDGKTGIIITHRLAAVSMADRILVLDHGRIVQEGSHLELLNEEGLYRQMWNIQANAFTESGR